MSVSSELQNLANDITAARASIVTKGGQTTPSGGSSQLATDIATIPTGITPTGTISITQNGTHDVTNYASADVNVSGAFKWGGRPEDFFNSSQPATTTLSDIVINDHELLAPLPRTFQYSTIKTITIHDPFTNQFYAYEYMCRNCDYLEEASFLRTYNGTTVNQYMCQYMFTNCSSLKKVTINSLDPSGPYGMRYICDSDPLLEEVNLGSMSNVNPTQYFSYGFRNCYALKKFNLKTNSSSVYLPIANISSTTNIFNYAFYNAYSMFNQTINTFRAPTISTIGYTSGTGSHSAFKQAFYLTSTYSSYYGKFYLILPELTDIRNRNSTSANGHFNGNNALGKIYLPKMTNAGTTGQYIFSSCNYLTEIHFGIENQATVEALAGYSSKFGATNATLYFDMPNHLTVNGTVYDRYGGNYDYDNSYYSWENGNNIIYTTNAINPAVGDTVYTKSGDTYTASGTIGAVA